MAETQFRLRGDDPVSLWFRRLAARGHYAGRSFATRQGIYVCTPGGELLASTPPVGADSVRAVLRSGLAAWNAGPARHDRPPDGLAALPVDEDRFPVDGLVLELTVRDLGSDPPRPAESRSEPCPDPPRSTAVERRSNLDHVWFSRREAAQWVPDPLRVGATRDLPDPLVRRLVGLHLLDSVSMTLPARIRPEDVGDSGIRTEVIGREGSRVRLRITGSTRGVARQHVPWLRSTAVETRLLGFATFDTGRGAFDRFELVALGESTGLPGAAGLGEAGRPRPIGFALVLADPHAPRTPPHFFHRYGGEWAPAGEPRDRATPASVAAPRRGR